MNVHDARRDDRARAIISHDRASKTRRCRQGIGFKYTHFSRCGKPRDIGADIYATSRKVPAAGALPRNASAPDFDASRRDVTTAHVISPAPMPRARPRPPSHAYHHQPASWAASRIVFARIIVRRENMMNYHAYMPFQPAADGFRAIARWPVSMSAALMRMRCVNPIPPIGAHGAMSCARACHYLAPAAGAL